MAQGRISSRHRPLERGRPGQVTYRPGLRSHRDVPGKRDLGIRDGGVPSSEFSRLATMTRGAPDRRHLFQIGTSDGKPVKKSSAGMAYDALGSQIG